MFDFEHLPIQQWIDGEPPDVCAIFAHGEPRSVYVQRKLRTWPVDEGRATIVKTIEDPVMRAAGLAIMRALRWHGPIQSEFQVERRTGKPYLLDVNGRLWAVTGLSTAAGLDFPSMYCHLAVTGDLEPSHQCRAGVRLRWPFPFALLSLVRSCERLQVLKGFSASGSEHPQRLAVGRSGTHIGGTSVCGAASGASVRARSSDPKGNRMRNAPCCGGNRYPLFQE